MAIRRVLVEMRVPRGLEAAKALALASDEIKVAGLEIDEKYQPIAVPASSDVAVTLAAASEDVMVARGNIEEGQEEALERDPRVVAVWSDPDVEVFATEAKHQEEPPDLDLTQALGDCPCPPCDCPPTDRPPTAVGDLAAVARYLGADRIWTRGHRGNGIVIGICDTGVRRRDVPNLIDGWSPSGGSPWGDNSAHYHGTMCAVDALGVCPEASILDMGILKSGASGVSGFLSDAIAAYDWALTRYRRDGTPQILSNSWGVYRETASWRDYTRNPNHPFNRKVVQAIHAGILVCFAAGNCGETCPSRNCGSENIGPGRSILGANGHPLVITVGAANIRNEWIGYSSQGPATLDPRKPDVCAPSHFRGYTSFDNGTSAACPIVAGVLGLLRNAKPSLRQGEAKDALQATAHDICAPGWDRNSGHGIIRAEAAYIKVTRRITFPFCGVQWRGRVPANRTVRWFTFNWPAYWHVVWTVVPTTPRSGNPQIKWKVQVERASGDHITYWISVTNLTSTDVDIEGRYCVLGTS